MLVCRIRLKEPAALKFPDKSQRSLGSSTLEHLAASVSNSAFRRSCRRIATIYLFDGYSVLSNPERPYPSLETRA
jgi:hypothetical protein